MHTMVAKRVPSGLSFLCPCGNGSLKSPAVNCADQLRSVDFPTPVAFDAKKNGMRCHLCGRDHHEGPELIIRRRIATYTLLYIAYTLRICS